MSNSREISQLASFITVDDATKNIGITSGTTSFVGIGSTSPTVKLDVLGDVKISGVVTATSFTGIINSSVGIVTALSGTAVTFTTGNITTLSGSNAYYNSGIVTTLSGTNLTYTNGNVTSLAGTAVTFTTGNITTLSGSNAYYNTGIVTTLSGTNLTYSNSSLTSITGTSATITTGNITTLSGSNSYYNVGVITALTGTSATITSANITTLSGSNLYYNTGIVTTLSGTNINYSGISTFGSILINAGIISATSPSGIVTYYGDGRNLTGVNAFNVINQTLSSSLVYPTFASNVGVSSIGISTTQVVFVPSTGNIGIGTTNPTSKLQVSGDVSVSGIVTATTFSGTLIGYASSAGISTNLNDGLAGNVVYQSAPNTTAFLANGTSNYVLQSNGVGNAPTWVPAAPSGAVTGLVVRDSSNNIVGTSGSISQLTFSSGLSVTGATGAAGIATITLSSNIVGTSLSITGISTFTNGPVFIGTASSTGTSSQPLQVTGGAYVSGSVGIGTTNPVYKLDVLGDINSFTAVRVKGVNILDEALRLSIAFG
jgi:hypothetical protein